MAKTRLAVIGGRTVAPILGIDLDGVFKPGVVYEAFEIMGEIVMRPIGEYTLQKMGEDGLTWPNEGSDIGDIIRFSKHLITKVELNPLTPPTNNDNGK